MATTPFIIIIIIIFAGVIAVVLQNAYEASRQAKRNHEAGVP